MIEWRRCFGHVAPARSLFVKPFLSILLPPLFFFSLPFSLFFLPSFLPSFLPFFSFISSTSFFADDQKDWLRSLSTHTTRKGRRFILERSSGHDAVPTHKWIFVSFFFHLIERGFASYRRHGINNADDLRDTDDFTCTEP